MRAARLLYVLRAPWAFSPPAQKEKNMSEKGGFESEGTKKGAGCLLSLFLWVSVSPGGGRDLGDFGDLLASMHTTPTPKYT